MSSSIRYGVAMLSTYAVWSIGTLFMRPGWDAWYELLAKPPFALPSALFIPLLVAAYTLAGLALGLLWSHTELWHPWLGSFFVGLAFNAAWVMFFFGLHVIFIAVVDLLCLILITLVLILSALEIRRSAGYVLLPYLAWLMFAFYLTAGAWFMH